MKHFLTDMWSYIRVIVFLFIPLLIVSCGLPPGGFTPPPVVVLWDKALTDSDDDPLKLALFHPDGNIEEFDFAPQWSADAFVDIRSGLAAFIGVKDPLALDEAMKCFDMVTGEEMFAKTDGSWIPLGFIEEGWTLVVMKRETKFRLLHKGDNEREYGNFTDRGYRLKYTVYLIDVLTGETDEGRVVYDAGSDNIRWEDRSGFKPQLTSDTGRLFTALPEFPYITDEIGIDGRTAKLWALDLRNGEVDSIDLGDAIRNEDFSYLVSIDGGSIIFQSQAKGDTVSLHLSTYVGREREWGSLYLWRDGEMKLIAPLDGEHVKHQMGISRRGDTILYAEVEFDPVVKRPVEGTLKLYLNNHSGQDEVQLPMEGDVWNVSLSPGGRWVSYMVYGVEGLQVRLLDTAKMMDTLLSECGPYSRFYGFAGAGRGDIAIPHHNKMLFGFENPLARI